jgi:hypothetical protein
MLVVLSRGRQGIWVKVDDAALFFGKYEYDKAKRLQQLLGQAELVK